MLFYRKIVVSIFFVVGLQFFSQAQSPTIDSLQKIVESKAHDSLRILALRQWDDLIYLNNPELDLQLNKRIETISSERLTKKLNKKELHFFRKALASAYNNQGIIGTNKGNYVDATNYFYKAIRLQEKINDRSGVAKAYNNIALIYQNQLEFDKALVFLKKSYEIRKSINDSSGIANSIGNIGLNYRRSGNIDSAMFFFQQSYQIRVRLGNPLNIAYSLNDIAAVYSERKEHEMALKTVNEALELFKQGGEYSGISSAHINIGSIYYQMGNYDEAIKNAYASLDIALKINEMLYMRDANFLLYESYKKKGKFKPAFEAYEQFIRFRDSVTSDQNQRAVIQQQYKYTYEKKALADSVANVKREEVKNAEIAKQKAELKAKRIQGYLLFGGLALVIVFAIFMVNRFIVTTRQKKEIELQKHLVEEKQKEILDSIHYAKRIQQALLPSQKLFERHLKKK